MGKYGEYNKRNIGLRLEDELIEKIDKAAKRRGIKRTQYITYILSKEMEDEEKFYKEEEK